MPFFPGEVQPCHSSALKIDKQYNSVCVMNKVVILIAFGFENEEVLQNAIYCGTPNLSDIMLALTLHSSGKTAILYVFVGIE